MLLCHQVAFAAEDDCFVCEGYQMETSTPHQSDANNVPRLGREFGVPE